MTEIISFKEYIERQKNSVLSEEKKEDSTEVGISPDVKEVNDYYFAKKINFNDDWKTLFNNLNNFYKQLESTFNALKNGTYTLYTSELKVIDSNLEKNVSVPQNITHGNSIGNFRKKVEEMVKQNLALARESKIKADAIKNANKLGLHRAERQEDLINKLYPKKDETKENKPQEENPNENEQEEEFISSKETIDEASTLIGRIASAFNPFQRTNYGINAGIGNRYSEHRILNTAKRQLSKNSNENASDQDAENYKEDGRSILNVDTSFLTKMAKKYEKDSQILTERELHLIRNILNRAHKQINRFDKYGALNDNKFLRELYDTLNEAQLAIIRVGGELESMAKKYNNACIEMARELGFIKYQNEKYSNSSKAEKEIKKANEMVAKRKKKEELDSAIETAAQNKSDAKAAEKAEQHAQADKYDNEAVDYFINNITSKLKGRGGIRNYIIKQLNTQETLKNIVRLEALYLLAYLDRKSLENDSKEFTIGPKASNNEKRRDEYLKILQGLSAKNIDEAGEIVREIKKTILSSREMAELEKENLEKAISINAKDTIEKALKSNKVGTDDIRTRLQGIKDDRYPDLNRASDPIKIDSDNKVKIAGGNERKTAETVAYYALLSLINQKPNNSNEKKDYVNGDEETLNVIRSSIRDKKINEVINKTYSDIEKAGGYKKFLEQALRTLVDNRSDDGTTVNSAPQKKVSGLPAKDFEGEGPRPSNIFDYAVQKAKELQNR